MQTEVLHLSTDNFEPVQLKKAVELLKKDEPIIFPTETVYGLGVPYHSSKALERLNQLKKRDPKKPYTLHIAEKRDVYTFIPSLPPHIERVMDFFWPGPLTIILANGKGEKYGFRLPAHKVAQELIRQVGVPLCASSANPEGYSPPTTCEEALKFFMDKVHLAIDSGPSVLRQASTVVDFSYPKFRVLREGIISAKMIQKVAGFQILFVCTGNTCRSPMAEALFRHLFAQKLSISPEKLADLGYMVRSAGIFAQPNTPANPLAVQVMKEEGISLEDHRSRNLDPSDLDRADFIYVMTEGHLDILSHHFPSFMHKIQILAPQGISDPFGGDIQTYRQCKEEIKKAIMILVEDLCPIIQNKQQSSVLD